MGIMPAVKHGNFGDTIVEIFSLRLNFWSFDSRSHLNYNELKMLYKFK